MQIATDPSRPAAAPLFTIPQGQDVADERYSLFKVVRRNGSVVAFEPAKISIAVTKAFLAINGGQGAASARVREIVGQLTDQVVNALMRRQPGGGTVHIEDIQDQVELSLMRSGEHEVARAYVLYREERAKMRAQQKAQQPIVEAALTMIVKGQRVPLDMVRLAELIAESAEGLSEVEPDKIRHLRRDVASAERVDRHAIGDELHVVGRAAGDETRGAGP